jgi:glycosyltransferase involved in cell wall biosynthesis
MLINKTMSDLSSEKKRIAIIIPGGIGTGKNNIGVPVLERIVRLLASDFEIVVFSLFKINPDYKPKDFSLLAITHSISIFRYWKLFWAFRKNHRYSKFHVVHGFWALPSGCFAVLFGKLFGIRSLVSILGGDAMSLPEIGYGQLRNRLPRNLVFWTLRHADEVISLTQYLVDNLTYAGFQGKNIHIVPWGVDNSLFSYVEKKISDPVKFLHIGNLNLVKDQETLLRVFKIISEQVLSHLVIIGEGPQETRLKTLVHDLALVEKVTFQSLIPYEDLPSVYQQADILLHTSLSEGQCEVVTEAMSCGVIVCGTKVGLMYDLPSCCVSVSVKDVARLASGVLAVCQDVHWQEHIRREAHRWAKQHDIAWTVKKVGRLYEG